MVLSNVTISLSPLFVKVYEVYKKRKKSSAREDF